MGMFDWIFGKQRSPAEVMRAHQRQLNRAERELDREQLKLDQREKGLIREIKANAKAGNVGAARVQARDLMRLRNSRKRMQNTKTQLQAIGLRLTTVRSSDQMMSSMRSATTLLTRMNRSANLPALTRITQQFERENDMMEQRQDMIDEQFEEGLEDEDEEEADELVDQVLDEIGVSLSQDLPSAAQANTTKADTISSGLNLEDLAHIR
ncbi:vacuolar sorting protein Did4 [Schizosaccharomyces japonicus yFS275]|uniref:Vacuolar sorting protein Did4 n=1 Tax=Schizosaccharomyces japonicus (strain yFS275 / FY16936) TaxID=402676 RepID=B6K6Y8_SCHJY|nr:vacuolar sorting protein Did4 [Schizosaccharomyces japonicus yFS275]EEB09292.1 vacuolar sorting protein Did4 [Schizosaccharomyces japonicus yFS275]